MQNLKIPVLNFTMMDQLLRQSEYYAGAFPRWLALSKAYNVLDRTKHTSAFAIVGVSFLIYSDYLKYIHFI